MPLFSPERFGLPQTEAISKLRISSESPKISPKIAKRYEAGEQCNINECCGIQLTFISVGRGEVVLPIAEMFGGLLIVLPTDVTGKTPGPSHKTAALGVHLTGQT